MGAIVPGGKEREEVTCPHCGDLKFSEMTSQVFLVSKATDEQVIAWAAENPSTGKPMIRAVVYGDLSSESTSEQYPTVTLCSECLEESARDGENDAVVAVDGVGQGPCAWCGAEPT